ncbi:MAG: response regulator [Oscillospiraceae bacterium]|nr:response regulator [Oscillospiraceae bacterium]MCL2227477.1 response regulator [Oscillospiraceae bacterium]
MNILRSLKIRTKLLCGFFLLLAATVAVGFFGMRSLLEIDREYTYALTKILDHYAYIDDSLVSFINNMSDDLTSQATQALWYMGIASAFSLFASAAIALIISGAITKPLKKAASVLSSVRNGNLNINIDQSTIANDEVGTLLRDVLGLIGSVKSINAEVKGMIAAAADKGDLHHVIEADKYSGEWREIMLGLNRLAEAVDAPIVEIRDVMGTLSGGNFDRKVTGDYKGDFLQIKKSVNDTIDELARYVDNELQKERDTYELMQIILDSSPSIINQWDDNYNLLKTSRRSVELFGLGSQEEYIERFYDLMPEHQPCGSSSKEKALGLMKDTYENGYAEFEWMHQTLDGKLIPTFVTLVRAMHNGKVILIAFTTDLRKVKEAEELIGILQDNSPLFMETWDTDGNFIDCNKKLRETFGIKSNSEFVESPYALSPKYQPCGKTSKEKNTQLIELAKKNGIARDEWVYQLPSGEIIPTEATWVHVEHHDKSLIIGYAQDLRPVKAAAERERELEKKLLEKELDERIRLMFDAAPLVIEFWKKDYTPLDCNQTALDYYELSSKSEYTVHLPSFFDAEHPNTPAWREYLDEVFKAGSGQFDFIDYKPSGKSTFLEVYAVRMKFGGEDVVVTYAHDVTQIKELQMEQQRIEIAEESSRAKSNFLARMSHEIRTPITAVMGISEIELQNPDLPPHVEESFAKIHNSANILLGIVNDILDLSKIEAGKMSLVQESYEVASMIVDVVHLHLAHAGSNNIKFDLHVDENLPTYLVGDVVRIEQIINNLLSNAFKYTETGSVELYIQCRKDSPEDEYVTLVFSIIDTGYGMTPEQLGNLSNEYTRFHERENRFVGGTGLGIPIVFSLVDMMGATVDIESEVGSGTKVVVCIPQKIASTEILGKELSLSLQQFEKVLQRTAKRFDFEPESMPYGRVLVVDDVDANLYVAEGLLAFYDLSVETCSSGYEAIDIIKAGNVYDIVFMDHMMPGINGMDAMQQLRKIGYTHPIVALTANAMIGQAEKFIKAGFDGFISKPIRTKHLNAILTKHIRDKQPPGVIEAAKAAHAGKPIAKGNISSYQRDPVLMDKLRQDFVRSHENTFADISEYISAGDIETAHRLAHSLKNSAALILESSLARTAEYVERIFANRDIPPIDRLSALEGEITHVLESIGKAEEVTAVPSAATDFDKADAMNLLNKLEALLASQNVECMDYLDELCAIPGTALLYRQIEDFDFRAAAQTLASLKDEL